MWEGGRYVEMYGGMKIPKLQKGKGHMANIGPKWCEYGAMGRAGESAFKAGALFPAFTVGKLFQM